jgi:hypothetical protein
VVGSVAELCGCGVYPLKISALKCLKKFSLVFSKFPAAYGEKGAQARNIPAWDSDNADIDL